MSGVNTERQVNVAYDAGATQAYSEWLLGVAGPTHEDDLMGDPEDVHDLAFRVTGEKLDPDSDRAAELAEAYLDGYTDKWESLDDTQ